MIGGKIALHIYSSSVTSFTLNSMSSIKRWPIVSSKSPVSIRKLNLGHVGAGCSLIQPVGIGFVIAKRY